MSPSLRYYACLFCLCSMLLMAQDKPGSGDDAPPLQLRETQTVVSDHTASGGLLAPLRCDAEGNIYVRLYEVEHDMKTPVSRFNSKGERTAVFRIAGIPELEQMLAFGQFGVSPDGDLYQLAWNEKGNFVMRFGKDGTFKSKISIPGWFSSHQIAVFNNGSFLLSLVEGQTKEEPTGRPFIGIFDSKGQMVKRITDSRDDATYEAAKAASTEGKERGGLRAISFGQAVTANDGNAYLMRWTSPAIVYGVSPTGEVVRTFEIESEPGLMPAGMHIADRYLMLMFQAREDPRGLFKVLDLTTGELVGKYAVEKATPFGCFTPPNKFTFLTSQQKHVAFVQVEP